MLKDPENRAFIYPRRIIFADISNPGNILLSGNHLLFKEVINETPIISNCFPAMFISISNVYALDIQPGEWKMENGKYRNAHHQSRYKRSING